MGTVDEGGRHSQVRRGSGDPNWQTALGSNATAGPQMAERSSGDRYAVAVMGRSSVGKSAITLRFVENRFVANYDPTIEDTYTKKTTIGGTVAEVTVLDTAGQEPLCALRRNWMRHQNGFLFVFLLSTGKLLTSRSGEFGRMRSNVCLNLGRIVFKLSTP